MPPTIRPSDSTPSLTDLMILTKPEIVECSRFSGKWNAHYFDDWTVEMAIGDLSTRLKRVLE